MTDGSKQSKVTTTRAMLSPRSQDRN